jgi:hypothetical protein
MTGRTAIAVDNGDVDNITIPLVPGIDLAGRIVIDGLSGSNSTAEFAAMRVSVRADPFVPGMRQAFAAPAADGAFTMPGVFPGNYRVGVQPFQNPPAVTMLPSLNRQATAASITVSPAANPVQSMPALPAVPSSLQSAYIKSIRLGNTDVLDTGLQVDRVPEHPLEIVIGIDGGTIEGLAVDARHEPVSNVPVALVPDIPEAARPHRTDLFKSTITDAAGRFRLQGIAPGRYKLFSWEDAENGAWLSPEFLRSYEEMGRPVQVVEGSKENLDAVVIPPATSLR